MSGGAGTIRTLYVAGLDKSITDSALKAEFSKYAAVERVTIIKDKGTRDSKGFGYIVMRSADEASKALKEMDGRVMADKPIKVKYSHSGTPEWQVILDNRKMGLPERGRGMPRGRGSTQGRGRGEPRDRWAGREDYGPPIARGGRGNLSRAPPDVRYPPIREEFATRLPRGAGERRGLSSRGALVRGAPSRDVEERRSQRRDNPFDSLNGDRDSYRDYGRQGRDPGRIPSAGRPAPTYRSLNDDPYISRVKPADRPRTENYMPRQAQDPYRNTDQYDYAERLPLPRDPYRERSPVGRGELALRESRFDPRDSFGRAGERLPPPRREYISDQEYVGSSQELAPRGRLQDDIPTYRVRGEDPVDDPYRSERIISRDPYDRRMPPARDERGYVGYSNDYTDDRRTSSYGGSNGY